MEEQYRPKVVLLTRLAPDSCYIAKELFSSNIFDIVTIVTEKRIKGQFDLLRHKVTRQWKKSGVLSVLRLLLTLPYLYWQDRRMLSFQRQVWWQHSPPAFPEEIPLFCFDNLNSLKIEILLKDIGAEYFIVYGTRILLPRIFSQAQIGALNIHFGITPEYRGSKCEFWALYQNEPEMVGITIHMIDQGIDTGAVMAQQRTDISPNDNEISLRVKNVEAAVPLLEHIISRMSRGEKFKLNVSGRKSRLFSTPSPLQYIRLHQRLRRSSKQIK